MRSMLRYWLGLFIAFAIFSAGWLYGTRAQLGVATPSSRWVFDAYQHKLAAARAIAGPRVLIVAGSNAMFGIDSGLLEAYWRRPVVNLAVNAGLGLPYILDVSQRSARPGDVILMPIEYALLLDDGQANSQVIDYVMARDLDYWRSMSRWDQLRFSTGLSPERWLQGLQRLPDGPVTSGTYGAHHLDARGDQTHTAPADRSAADAAAVAGVKAWDYGARAAKESGGWKQMAAYVHWARAHDICVVAVPTVLLHHAKYDSNSADQAFYTGLPQRMEALGIPYVGKPLDFMYPPDWFFDTDHHLQNWAREKHTERLIALLNPDPRAYCKQADRLLAGK